MVKNFVKLTVVVVCCIVSLSCSAQIRIGGKTINTRQAVKAAGDLAAAVTLSDKDIAAMSRQAIVAMDSANNVSPETSEYSVRLKRITDRLDVKEINGQPVNYKVYETSDVNAFACGDGSIRVYSGLMELMDDDELVAILGHEIGHLHNTDVKDAMKNAYLASAVRNAAGSTGGAVATLSNSQVGALVQAFSGAQFSQKQEYAADDYGFEFSVSHGFSPYGMAGGLNKLVELSSAGGAKASTVQKMFSTHPDSEKRAARMKEKADAYNAAKQ